MRIVKILVLLILAPVIVFAETYSFEDVMSQAMKNNPEIIKAKKALDAVGAKRYAGFAALLPKASVGGLYTHLDQEPPGIDFSSIMMGQAPEIAGNPYLQYRYQDNYTGYLRITQPLFTGGRNIALMKASHYGVIAAEAGVNMAEGIIGSNVVRGYYGILVASEMQKLTQEAIKQLERHLKRVNNLKASGMATEYDSLKTEVRLLSWKPRAKQADRDFKNAKRRLALVMGLDPMEDFMISGDLKPDIVVPEEINSGEVLEYAIENRPEAIIAKQTYEMYVEKQRIEASFALPQVNLQYSQNYLNAVKDPELNEESWDSWWDIKVMANWEFFNFGGKIMDVKGAMDETEKMKKDYEKTVAEIKVEVLDIIEYREEMIEAVNVWEQNFRLAQKGYEIAENKYKNGTITNTEFLDSHLEQIEAKVQYYRSLLEYKVAESEFERITLYNKLTQNLKLKTQKESKE